MKKSEITENGLMADLFSADSAQPQKAIIMLGGSEGGRSWSRIKRPVELLVEKGYAVFSLAYFKEEGLSDTLVEIPLEYFERAFAWLSDQAEIIPDQFAVLGGSKGAEAALLLGSKYPQVKAVIAFSPSSVVWQGIPARRFDLGTDVRSSWSEKGMGLPYLPYPSSINKWQLMRLRLREMHEAALQSVGDDDEVVIPVENTGGAILLLSGTRDSLWPATLMSEQIKRRLKAKGFSYPYEHIHFNTGHNGIVMNKDSWRRIFAFLNENFQ